MKYKNLEINQLISYCNNTLSNTSIFDSHILLDDCYFEIASVINEMLCTMEEEEIKSLLNLKKERIISKIEKSM
jgi:hypothetical protein